jgi:hypothetical protein
LECAGFEWVDTAYHDNPRHRCAIGCSGHQVALQPRDLPVVKSNSPWGCLGRVEVQPNLVFHVFHVFHEMQTSELLCESGLMSRGIASVFNARIS